MTTIPAPGQAPLVAENAAALLRRNAREFGDRVAIKFGDRQWTHAEYFDESCRFAALFLERIPAGAPRHVAVLLDNTPDYLFAFGGAVVHFDSQGSTRMHPRMGRVRLARGTDPVDE